MLGTQDERKCKSALRYSLVRLRKVAIPPSVTRRSTPIPPEISITSPVKSHFRIDVPPWTRSQPHGRTFPSRYAVITMSALRDCRIRHPADPAAALGRPAGTGGPPVPASGSVTPALRSRPRGARPRLHISRALPGPPASDAARASAPGRSARSSIPARRSPPGRDRRSARGR